MTDTPPRFYTLNDLAGLLQVTVPTARQMLFTGTIAGGFQIGGRGIWRIEVADVDTWIEQQKAAQREASATG